MIRWHYKWAKTKIKAQIVQPTVSRLETKPPKIRENRSSKTTAEERATGRDQWQQPYTPMFLSFSGVSLGIAQKTMMSLHMIKNHIKTIWTHFPSQSRRNVTQFFPQRDSKTKVENRRKTEFIQKIKDIFGFSFKESSTAKPRRLKVTQKTENTQLLSRKSNTTE